jgi:hypothetical protein
MGCTSPGCLAARRHVGKKLFCLTALLSTAIRIHEAEKNVENWLKNSKFLRTQAFPGRNIDHFLPARNRSCTHLSSMS